MKNTILAISTSMFIGSLAAAPAAWHTWSSKATGQTVCAQISPGEGWRYAQGPYRDAQCTRPGLPG